MTSKEYIQGVLYNLKETLKFAEETNNKDLELDCKMQIESYNQVLKDLEVLEEIRDYFKVIDYGEEYQNRYALQVGNIIIPELKKETYDKWNRWLNKK